MSEIMLKQSGEAQKLERDFDYDKIENIETNKIDELINNLKKINLLPFYSQQVYFKSDKWDFSSYKITNIGDSTLIFLFHRCPIQFKEVLKVYALYKLLENRIKLQTIRAHIYVLINFFKYASDLNYKTVHDFTARTIEDFLDSRDVSAKTRSKHRVVIKSFYQMYAIKFEDIGNQEIDKVLSNTDSRIIKAQAIENKTDNIPNNYYKKFVNVCENIARDATIDNWLRALACVYLILSQTGLRIGECLSLTTESLKEINYYKGNKNNYLFYSTWKRVRGERGVHYAFTYANKLTILAIETLTELYKDRRKQLDVKYLYLGGSHMRKPCNYPVIPDTFLSQSQRLFIFIDDKLKTINLPNEYYKGITNKKNRLRIEKYQHVETIAMPTTPQFRVHVVTELINKGVHIKYVQKFMSHLSADMTAHYATPKESYLKESDEVNLAKDTLERIITGEEKLLGASSNEFVEGIQSFIKGKKFNVEKDLDTIIENLIEKYPIKQKAGGYLIAPLTIRRTTTDILSDKYYEKYGFETSGFTFYYMIDHTYKQAVTLSKIVDYNLANGYKKEAKVELVKLKNTAKDLLKPELSELKNKIEQLGINNILQEHPNLFEIMENIDNVEKELNKWLKIEI